MKGCKRNKHYNCEAYNGNNCNVYDECFYEIYLYREKCKKEAINKVSEIMKVKYKLKK